MVYAILMLVAGVYASFILLRHLKFTYDILRYQPELPPDPHCRACGAQLDGVPSNLGHNAVACGTCLPVIEDELAKMLPEWYTNPLPKLDPDAQFGPTAGDVRTYQVVSSPEGWGHPALLSEGRLGEPNPRASVVPLFTNHTICIGCGQTISVGTGMCHTCVLYGANQPFDLGRNRW